MKLFPLLLRTEQIDQLVLELMASSILDCRAKRRLNHLSAVISPTGGTPAVEKDLQKIASELTAIAERFGYPDECTDSRSVDAFWSEFLHRNLNVTPHEAAKDEMWNFITCILVPDLVKWRWNSNEADAPSERWITIRRRGRNCFGRLWWRSEILSGHSKNSYEIVHALKEDEFIQIMERPSLAGNRNLSRATAQALAEFGKRKPKMNRALVFREVQKRLLRMGAYLEFEALEPENLRSLLSEVFIQADLAMQRGGD